MVTEVLVCHIYSHHEFIVLENSVKCLYFQSCSSASSSCIHYCSVMAHAYQLHKS